MKIGLLNFCSKKINQIKNIDKILSTCIYMELVNEDYNNKNANQVLEIQQIKKISNFILSNKFEYVLILNDVDEINDFDLNQVLDEIDEEGILTLNQKKIYKIKEKIVGFKICDYPYEENFTSIFDSLFESENPNFIIKSTMLIELLNLFINKKINLYSGLFSLKNLVSIYLYTHFKKKLSKNILLNKIVKMNSNENFLLAENKYRPILEIISNPNWSKSIKNFENFLNLKTENYYDELLKYIISKEFQMGLKNKLKDRDKVLTKFFLNILIKLFKYKKLSMIKKNA